MKTRLNRSGTLPEWAGPTRSTRCAICNMGHGTNVFTSENARESALPKTRILWFGLSSHRRNEINPRLRCKCHFRPLLAAERERSSGRAALYSAPCKLTRTSFFFTAALPHFVAFPRLGSFFFGFQAAFAGTSGGPPLRSVCFGNGLLQAVIRSTTKEPKPAFSSSVPQAAASAAGDLGFPISASPSPL